MLERAVAVACRELFGRLISPTVRTAETPVSLTTPVPSPIESLERRVLLASIPLPFGSGQTTTPDGALISVTGVPDWRPQGPTIHGGQVVGITNQPVSGAIETVLTVPSATPGQPDVLYVGTIGGGIWRSTNGGGHWTPLTDQLPSTSISALAVDPMSLANPAGPTLWAGTGSVSSASFGGSRIGLLKSIDGGQSWSIFRMTETVRAVVPTRIVQGTGHVVLVATERGLYRSTDGGATGQFAPVTGSELPAGSFDVSDLKADPTHPDWFYAAIAGQGVFFSNDGGQSWKAVNLGLGSRTQSLRIELALSNAPVGGLHPVYAGVIARPSTTITAQAGNVLTVADATLFERGDTLPLGIGATRESIKIASINHTSNQITLETTPANPHAGEVLRLGGTERLAGVFRSTSLSTNGPAWFSMGLPRSGDTVGGTLQLYGLHPGGQGDRHFSILADSSDVDVVYVGGDRQPIVSGNGNVNAAGLANFVGRLFRGDATPDSGLQTWKQIVGSGASNTAPHADSRGMVFDRDGNILEVNDGGIVKLTNPSSDTRRWESINGNLALTEFYAVDWDAANDRIVGGAQDVGVSYQSGPDSFVWTTLEQGDGVHVVAANGTLYYSSQFFGFNVLVDGTEVKPAMIIAGADRADGSHTKINDLEADLPFHTLFVANAVHPERLLFGTRYLYEALSGLDDGKYLLSPVQHNPVLNSGNYTADPAARLGQINAMIYGWKSPSGSGLPDQPGLIYAGAAGTAGRHLLVRRDASLDPQEQLLRVVTYPGAEVLSLSVDPSDWRKLYVLDSSGDIWFTEDGDQDPSDPGQSLPGGGQTGWAWTKVSTGVKSLRGGNSLRAIEFLRVNGQSVLLAGGEGGVFRKIGNGPWGEYGGGLPNAIVTDITYDAGDDMLVIGSLGRGAWRLDDASQSLTASATVSVTGSGGNDVFRVRRDPAQPWRIDIFHHLEGNAAPSVPSFWIDLTPVRQLNINGGDGDDTILIDTAHGPIAVSGNVQVNGDNGLDGLLVINGAAAHQDLDVPAGHHTVTANDAWRISGTQRVNWSSIEQTPDPAALDNPMGILRSGVTNLADSFQDGLVEAAAQVAMGGVGSRSVGNMLNGVIVDALRPKDDPFTNASQVSPGGFGQLDGASSVIRRLLEEGLNAFRLEDIGGLISSPEALRAALDNLDAIPGNVTLDQLTDLDGDGSPDLLLDARLSRVLEGIVDLDISADVFGGLGDIRLTGALAVSANVHLHLRIGIDCTGFFVLPSAGDPALRVTDLQIDGELRGRGRLGFLGVEVRDATLSLDPDVSFAVYLSDPEADDGGIRLPELSLDDLTALFGVEIEGDPGDSQADVAFNATYALTTVLPGTNLSFDLASAEVPIEWANLSVPTLADLLPGSAQAQELLRFIGISPDDVLADLHEVQTILEQFMTSDEMDFPLPFATDARLAELIDLAGAFQEKVLGALETAPGSGIPTFGTLQELASRLAGSLGIDISTNPILNYDPATGRLWFDVPMHVIFDPVSHQLTLASSGGPGTSFAADAELEAALTFNFSFGYDMDAPDPAGSFFFRINELGGELTATVASAQAFTGNLGLFETTVNNGALVLSADVNVLMSGADLSLGNLAGAFAGARTQLDSHVLLAADGITGFLGNDGLGLNLTGGRFAFGFFSQYDSFLAQQAPATFALDASGDASLAGLADLVSLSGSGRVRWNSDATDGVNFTDIGGTGVDLVLSPGEASAAVFGTASVRDFANLSGQFSLGISATTFNATEVGGGLVQVAGLLIGGSNLFGFAGTGGPYWQDSNGDGVINNADTPAAAGAAGLAFSNLEFSLGLFRPTALADARRYYALNARADQIQLVGFESDGVTLSAQNINLHVNDGAGTANPRALNLSLTPQDAPGSSLPLNFSDKLFRVATTITLETGPVTLEGDLIAGLVNERPVWEMPGLSAEIDGVVSVSAEDVVVHLEPASANQPLLTVASARAVLENVLGGELTFDATGLSLSRGGTFSFTSASITSDNLLDRIGLGEFLPLTISSISAAGLDGQAATFERFRLTVTGRFNDDLFGSDLANPVIDFGGFQVQAGASFGFGVQVGSGSGVTGPGGSVFLLRQSGGSFIPLDGPMRLGFEDMDFGAFVVDAVFSFGEFDDGIYHPLASIGFEGKVRSAASATPATFEGGLQELGFSASVAIIPQAGGGLLLDVTNASITTSFDTGPSPLVQLRVEGLEADFQFQWLLDAQFQLVSSSIDFIGAAADRVLVRFGGSPGAGDELMLFEATDAAFHFRDQSQHWMTFGSMSASFPQLQSILIGTAPNGQSGPLTGTVSNFAIGRGFEFIPLPGNDPNERFGVVFDEIPSPATLGLPDWLPFHISKVGLEFGPGAIDQDGALKGTLDDIFLLTSAGINTPQGIPIQFDASISDLRVNIGTFAGLFTGGTPSLDELLAAVTFTGFEVGVEKIDIGGVVEIGGRLGLRMLYDGVTDRNILVGTIGGYFGMNGFGGGIELTLAEVGPIAARIDVPLGIPLGPSGLAITGVGGGFRFGGAHLSGELPGVDLNAEPGALARSMLGNPTTFSPLHFDPQQLDQQILDLVRAGDFTWSLPFTLALSGEVGLIASPAALSGNLNLAAQVDLTGVGQGQFPRVQFLASGDVRVFGIPVGGVGGLIDVSHPLDASYYFAAAVPLPGSFLSFLLPGQATADLGFTTGGMFQAPLIGAGKFAQSLLNGSLNAIKPQFQALVAEIIDSLRNGPSRPNIGLNLTGTSAPRDAASLLLPLLSNRPAGMSESDWFIQQLFNLLPATPSAIAALSPAALERAVNVVNALTSEMYFNAPRLVSSGTFNWNAILDAMTAATAGAITSGLQAGWDAFDPRLKITAAVKPKLFGFEIGNGTEFDIRISKDGLSFGADGTLEDLVSALGFPIGTAMQPFMGLGVRSNFSFDFAVTGIAGIFESLFLSGQLPGGMTQIDLDLNVSGKVLGSLSFLDFDLASISGLIVSPTSPLLHFDNAQSVSNGELLRVYNLPNGGVDPDTGAIRIPPEYRNLIPIATEADYLSLTRFGGLLFTGQLFAPAMLADPVDLIADGLAQTAFGPHGIFTPPDDILQYPDYFDRVYDFLSNNQEMARFQLYVPSPLALAEPGVDPQEVADAFYARGFFTHKILSVPLGTAMFEATTSGLKVSAEIPWLAGLDTEFTIAQREFDFRDLVEDFALKFGYNINLGNLPALPVNLPVAGLTVSMGSAQLEDFLTGALRLPANTFTVPGSGAATLGMYSPGFADPSDPDASLVQRVGGVEMFAKLNIEPFVRNASFRLEAPLFTGSLVPEFLLQAHVDRIRFPSGFVAEDIFGASLDLLIRSEDGVAEMDLEGDAHILGLIHADVEGHLRISSAGLVGILNLTSSGSSPEFTFPGLSLGSVNISNDISLLVNTTGTDRTVNGTPILASDNFALKAGLTISLFAAGEDEGISFVGNLTLKVRTNDLLIEGSAALVVDLPLLPELGGELVRGKLYLSDRYIEGSFTAADLIDLGFDRFGRFTLWGVVTDPFFGQRAYVDDRRFTENTTTTTRNVYVKLVNPADRKIIVEYELSSDSALLGEDWDAPDGTVSGGKVTGTVTIGKGVRTSGGIKLRILSDNLVEVDEHFKLRIVSIRYADNDEAVPVASGFGSSQITIIDTDEPAPELAHVENGTLILHVGPNTHLRSTGEADGADEITVTGESQGVDFNGNDQVDPDVVLVEGFGLSQVFTGVSRIYADLGAGDDELVLDETVTRPAEIDGGEGNDVIHAGSGNDTVDGGSGNDTVRGGAGRDALTGGTGADSLLGGDGRDTLRGGAGNDSLIGGDHDDHLVGDDGDDAMLGDTGTITRTRLGQLVITPSDSDNAGDDLLEGGLGDDAIHGGQGDDTLTGGAGIDVVHANAGDDAVLWSIGDGDDSAVSGGDGTDDFRVQLGSGDDDLRIDRSAGQFRLVRRGAGGAPIEGVTADSGFERLDVEAGAGADRIEIGTLGGAELATVELHLGNPDGSADGSADEVILEGDSAADSFSVSNPDSSRTHVSHSGVTAFDLTGTSRAAGDALRMTSGHGNDTLDASAASHDLLALALVAGEGNDRLIGSRFDDGLDGGLGNDTLTGGPGTDTFADAGGSDTLIETRDADFTITDDTLVIGALAGFSQAGIPGAGGVVNSPLPNLGSAYAPSAEFERIGGVFEHATLTGGTGSNTLIVGDGDGLITHGAAVRSALHAWTGTLVLDNAGSTGGFVEYYLIHLASAAGARISVADSGASDYDELYVIGTGAGDTFRVSGSTVIAGDPASALRGEVSAAGVAQLTIDALGGDDTLNVRQTTLPTVLHGRSGSDTTNVGSAVPAGGGTVNAIAAALYVSGNEGSDSLNVDDAGDAADNSGTLTGTRLTGLGMTGGITYASLEVLDIELGSGSDTLNVQGTHAGTTSVAGNAGSDTFHVGSTAPGTGGTVNAIGGLLAVNAGAGSDILNVDDTGDPADNTGRLTGTRLSGLGMGGDDPAKGIAYSGFDFLNVNLGSGNDDFLVDATHGGATTVRAGGGVDEVVIEGIVGLTSVLGQAGDDQLIVNRTRPAAEDDSETNGLIGTLDLDGGDGSDRYDVWIWGNGNSLINAFDSGTSGADVLSLRGTSIDDTFLLRANFVAAVADKSAAGAFGSAERVNYNASMNGGLVISGRAGSDYFASDDNAVQTTFDGGAGNDRFQIGQMFEADRLPPHVAPGDVVQTTLTTVGYLTNGVSHGLTVHGGDGEDNFVVFRNKAVVNLNGDAGNDVFTVRAFALANGQTDVSTTNVTSGGGDDTVQYAENAPVNVDGGSGFDRVRILGTEFGDRFVITEAGVFGAGVTVNYVSVEALEVHGGDGEDTFHVLSTSAGVATYLFGGAGSDRFFIADGIADPGFGSHVRSLSNIRGPLSIDGAPGDPSVFTIPVPVMLPGETDVLDGGHSSDGNHSPDELPGDVDTIDIVSVDDTADLTGTLTHERFSGLGMGGDLSQEVEPGQFVTVPGGITYGRAEIMEVRLGSGTETLHVQSLAADLTTLLHGNAGDDRFLISAPAVDNAMLVVYGDTAASQTHRDAPGDDFIDARLSSHAATYYGGAGDDTIYGSSAGDRIAGGSGNDSIDAGAGNDLVWGDSGFDVDRDSRVTTILTSGNPGQDDFAQAGNDTIHTGTGHDLAFGDHGEVTPGLPTGGSANVLGEGAADVILARTVQPGVGGQDAITHAGGGNAYLLGGAGQDSLTSGDGQDVAFGDHGRVTFEAGVPTLVETTSVTGGADVISTGEANDLVLGGAGADDITAGAGNDLLLGDHGRITLSLGKPVVAEALDLGEGAGDSIDGGAGEDVILGQSGGDTISAGAGHDLVVGDHGRVDFDSAGAWSKATPLETWIGSGDSISAGAGDDVVLGQAGGDTISGNAGQDVLIGDNALVHRAGGALLQNDLRQRFGLYAGGTLYNADGSVNLTRLGAGDAFADPLGVPHLSVLMLDHDATTPDDGRYGADSISGSEGNDVAFGQLGDDTLDGGAGDDYVEGNGGSDSIRGGLGQDDLVGGSSDRFGLTTRELRVDSSDRIYGGDGSKTGRNAPGDLSDGGHARDADVILGDNGNVLVVFDVSTGTYAKFNYDDYPGTLRIRPRAVQMLDYTPGVPGSNDGGAGDLVHGEDGDDSVWGMTGSDALFGGGGDDDLVGGNDHDWISGGAGADGILGDDGFIKTSRNGQPEPLHGIAAVTNLNESIRTPGGIQQATIHLTGRLKKEVDLEPFELGGDDIVYGGLGSDSIHGGQGDDALSGAEALPELYDTAFAFSTNPINAGNVLGYGQFKDGEFAQYDEYDPWKRVDGHLLNFAAGEADGDDAVFGDLGNDWIVGGTGSDRLYGGRGDDLLNVDDNLDTNGGLNNAPDGGQWAGFDLAYGGAGRDVLIANSQEDRLIDWVGEFNSYIVPFAQYGSRAISRTLQPQLPEFLLKLATSDGLDLTRIDPNDPTRLGEPHGELGMVRQQDPDWREQTGAPSDPQAGNIPGGPRDTFAAQNFNTPDGAAIFAPDTGAWSISNGAYLADYGGDTVSVMFLEDELPFYFEIQATARSDKARAGKKANAYIIFDYRSATDFKYAGFNDANDQVVIGQRTAAGWELLRWDNYRIQDASLQLMKLVVNGTTATLVMNNTVTIAWAFDRRLDDGMIGLGVDNSRTRFDNVEVLVLPPATNWQFNENFDGGGSGGLANVSGSTSVGGGRFIADATGGTPAIAIRNVGASANSFLELHADLQVSAGGFAGLVFDYYSPTDFKYVAYDASTHSLVIGHRTSQGWFTDATYSLGSKPLGRLGMSIRGTTVSVMMSGVPLFGHVYNAALADGGIGLFARSGTALFDNLLARGDDPEVLL